MADNLKEAQRSHITKESKSQVHCFKYKVCLKVKNKNLRATKTYECLKIKELNFQGDLSYEEIVRNTNIPVKVSVT